MTINNQLGTVYSMNYSLRSLFLSINYSFVTLLDAVLPRNNICSPRYLIILNKTSICLCHGVYRCFRWQRVTVFTVFSLAEV